MPSVIVATPQVEEADALLGGFLRQGLGVAEIQIGRLECAAVPLLDLVVAVAGNGKAQFAVQAQHLLDHCPDATLLVCAGTAGSLVDVLSPGDVVVATATIEHDYKERFSSEPLPSYEADADALTGIRQAAAANTLPFRLTFGRIASGDEDIVTARRATQLRAATGAVCVAWEGSGGARAAHFSGIGFLEIRGITDSADHLASESFREHLAAAMSHVSRVVLAWQMHRVSGAEAGSAL